MREHNEIDAILAKLAECEEKYPEKTQAGESNSATFDDCKSMLKGEKTMSDVQEEFDNDQIGGNHLAWCMDVDRWLKGEMGMAELFGEAVIIDK